VQGLMLNGSETWPVKDNEIVLQWAEMRMTE